MVPPASLLEIVVPERTIPACSPLERFTVGSNRALKAATTPEDLGKSVWPDPAY
jgi:hypothetical protein